MTAGYFAPLPPAPTGVADYAVHLLAALREHGTVAVAPRSATVNLYHLGNNQLHRGIYRRALEEPGVIVLHDAVLHHFALGFYSESEYIEEFVYNYGEWHRSLAKQLWDARAKSAADPRYFAYPMLRRIVERSRAVIVHNPAAADAARRHCPDALVFEIPHLFFPPYLADNGGTQVRERLGIPPSGLLCGIFGYLRESKRIRTAMQACEAAGSYLLLAGTMTADLERALAPWLNKPHILRIGRTSDPEFRSLVHTVDVCINLRYPNAGETSGIGVNLMAIGKPVLFTRSPEVSRYPEAACVRIDSGLAEKDHLEQVLVWLKRSRFDRHSIGEIAARYIRTEHSPGNVAALYWQAIRAVA